LRDKRYNDFAAKKDAVSYRVRLFSISPPPLFLMENGALALMENKIG